MVNHTGFPRINAAGVAAPTGLYHPANEHDSCGVGFVARLTALPDHSIVEHAVQVLVNLEHRGAIGGDKSTGDGSPFRHRDSTRRAWSSCRRTWPLRTVARKPSNATRWKKVARFSGGEMFP
jgi:hypothetical protein